MLKSDRFFIIHIILLLFCVFASLSIVVTAQSPAARNECEVNGTFTDQYGAIALGVSVSYTNPRIQKTAKAGDTGKYSLTLPSGVYEVSVQSGLSKPRYERARVAVTCLQNIELNIVLLPECVSYGCQSLGYSFATFRKGWSRRNDLNIVIAYSKRAKSRSRTEYDKAVLTYDTYTLLADKIIQDFKLKTFVAEGKVRLENGKNRTGHDKLTIRFTEGGVPIFQ